MGTTFSHVAITCATSLAVERWYTRHFGFARARVTPRPGQVVMIKRGDLYLELFPVRPGAGSAGESSADHRVWRHLAFLVDDLDAKLVEMGDEARINLGPLDMGAFIPGMRSVWLADPEGNVVELNHGYVDEADPPGLDG